MAAAKELRTPELVGLGQIRARDLNPLLDQEIAEWLARLGWDFGPSAELVRRFVAMQSLGGYALVDAGKVVGYNYFISEDGKGLIGDLYLLESHRSLENEVLLLAAALADLFRTMSVKRVESQLMLLRSSAPRFLPINDILRVHPRHYMMIDSTRALALKPGRAAHKALIENWSARRQDEAAHVIAAAYHGHLDSDVNDQYLSVSGARRFLANIMQYPGCGVFFQPASYVAVDVWTGKACGLSLTSMLSPGVGHVTQICVVPTLKGSGLGYELLRRSLLALAEAGCRRVSLTVTVANADAVGLYERVGFETAHTFSALVWERA